MLVPFARYFCGVRALQGRRIAQRCAVGCSAAAERSSKRCFTIAGRLPLMSAGIPAQPTGRRPRKVRGGSRPASCID
jgi:hypothetical protein